MANCPEARCERPPDAGGLVEDKDHPQIGRDNNLIGPMSWIQQQISDGVDPRELLNHMLPGASLPGFMSDFMLWKLIWELITEPAPRKKISTINLLVDAVDLLRKSKNVVVLTGAGVSVACGIPDFRSRDGVYARLSKDFPDLPDPQAMFDIHYFRSNPKPFFKFAKEIYPGQFVPSLSHRFIAALEQKNRLLRNYTQNIDTLEQVAGISKLVQCHGSFATASCTNCKLKVKSDVIKADIFNQVIPVCPNCGKDENNVAVMKPDIVFFGENLSNDFYETIDVDKQKIDLLIVIGSSLKVRPVALIPNLIDASVPQILINREPLPHFNFDVELLGNCDAVICHLCKMLGKDWLDVIEEYTMPHLDVDTLLQDSGVFNETGAIPITDGAGLCEFPSEDTGYASAKDNATSADDINDDSGQLLRADPKLNPDTLLQTKHNELPESQCGVLKANDQLGCCSNIGSSSNPELVVQEGDGDLAHTAVSKTANSCINATADLPQDTEQPCVQSTTDTSAVGKADTSTADKEANSVLSATKEINSLPLLDPEPVPVESGASTPTSSARNKRKPSTELHHEVCKELKSSDDKELLAESELCTGTDKVHIDPNSYEGQYYIFLPPSRYIFHGAELFRDAPNSGDSSSENHELGEP